MISNFFFEREKVWYNCKGTQCYDLFLCVSYLFCIREVVTGIRERKYIFGY